MAAIHFDITGDNEQVLKSLQQTINAITQLGDTTEKTSDSVAKSSKSMSGVTKELQAMASRYLSTAAVIGVFAKTVKDALKLNADFERKNSELASVLGTTKEGVQDLSLAAEQLGRVTEFTATEVTELQLALARLGFTKNQITDMEDTVLKFAAAVNADLGRAAAFSGAALRGFGLEAKDTTHLLDVMAAATSKSALDFSKLETSISIVAPVAHAFGLSVEDTVTLLGSLANAGFDASSAATATRNILLNLADANGKLAKGLGHTARTFPEIIDALNECTEKGIDLNTTLEMTDKRSVAAFSSLISGAASADELRKALGGVDGTLEQMYETMTNNVTGAVNELKSAWQGLLLKFQESNGPIAEALRNLAKLINLATDVAEYSSTAEKEKRGTGWLSMFLPGAGQTAGLIKGAFKTGKNAKEVVEQNRVKESVENIREQFTALYEINNEIDRVERLLAGDLVESNKGMSANELKEAFRQGEERRKELTKYLGDLKVAQRQALDDELNKGADNLINEITEEEPPKTPPHQLTDEEKKAIERYKKSYEKLVKSLWKSVSETSVKAMKEGREKELAEIELSRNLALAAIDEEQEELETNAKGAGIKISQEIYDQFAQRKQDVNTIADNELLELQKKNLKELNENRWAYLEQYGSYKEKELAITEKYDAAIAEAEDKFTRQTLGKEKEKALDDLERQYR